MSFAKAFARQSGNPEREMGVASSDAGQKVRVARQDPPAQITMNARTSLALLFTLSLVLSSPRSVRAAEETMLPGETNQPATAAAAAAVPIPVANLIHGIIVTPPSPNIVAFGSNISISASYKTTEAGGVRIFFRPLTGSKLTPNYGASGSPLYGVGSGTASGTFTIAPGPKAVKVTKIRCQMFNDLQGTLLQEWLVPVNFTFK